MRILLPTGGSAGAAAALDELIESLEAPDLVVDRQPAHPVATRVAGDGPEEVLACERARLEQAGIELRVAVRAGHPPRRSSPSEREPGEVGDPWIQAGRGRRAGKKHRSCGARGATRPPHRPPSRSRHHRPTPAATTRSSRRSTGRCGGRSTWRWFPDDPAWQRCHRAALGSSLVTQQNVTFHPVASVAQQPSLP